MENKNYFKKGFYNRKQPDGYPMLKQYILLEKNGKRCLLLRFANETELSIDQMKFELTQLDDKGKVIKKSKVEYKNMRFYPERTYSSPSGIVVVDECVDFYIDVLYVVSGRYKYVARHGKAVATYDLRGYSGSDVQKSGRTKIKTAEMKPSSFRLIAAISLILVILSCCFAFLKKDEEEGYTAISDAPSITETITET